MTEEGGPDIAGMMRRRQEDRRQRRAVEAVMLAAQAMAAIAEGDHASGRELLAEAAIAGLESRPGKGGP